MRMLASDPTNVSWVQFQPSGICGTLSSLLVLSLLQGFFSGLQFSCLHKKTMSPILNSSRIEHLHKNQLMLMWLLL